MVEGGFVRTVLVGPLHWQGIVDLDREDHPGMFRLLPGAATILSPETPVGEEIPWGRLIVQPNFELIALAPVSEVLLVSLDRFAERVSLEHIAQYRLTKASVTRAIQAGLHAETIQAQLERAAGGEIPQNVRYSLQEWERQARRVEVWQGATLVEVDDARPVGYTVCRSADAFTLWSSPLSLVSRSCSISVVGSAGSALADVIIYLL